MPASGDKDTRGSVFVVAGSAHMPGAAMLCATAALHAGAGRLALATAASVATLVGANVLESLVLPLRETPSGAFALAGARAVVERAGAADALVVGPGMTGKAGSHAFVRAVIAALEVPAVIDAIAIGAGPSGNAAQARFGGRAVLTPHAGEMASLLGRPRETVEAEPERHTRDVARSMQAVVALKGGTTYIADADGTLYRHSGGVIGLATSGSGDVLAGVIGGLLARGLAPLPATLWGVYLHAQAGLALMRDVGLGFLARDLSREIPRLMRAHTETA